MSARGLWPLAVAVLCGGCMVESDHRHGPGFIDADPPAPLVCDVATGSLPTVGVETGQTLTATPGDGVGIFFEYAGGGQWHVWDTCDTRLTGYACEVDVRVTVVGGGAITRVVGDALEPGDAATAPCADAARLVATTTTDVDGMWVDAPAGATLRVDALIDGARDARLLYWIGTGALHAGAAVVPLDMRPETP